MQKLTRTPSNYVTLLFYGLILIGLYLTSRYSYLLFHSLVEIFTVIVGYSIFILAWNSRQRLDNNYLLFLGIAYLYVSGIDLLHTLSYKGMGVFQGYDANLPTQLWIAARYLQSLSLLISPLFLHRKLRVDLFLVIYTMITILVLAAIFSDLFPVCYVEGAGLTPFKVVSEYVISLILTASILLLLRQSDAFDPKVLQWLILSLILTIGAELIFTTYVNVTEFPNLVGHYFKLVSFYLVYLAIVETGLEKPHRLLFKNLKQNEAVLQNALEEVQRLANTDSLTGLHNRRHFSILAEKEVQRACRYQHPLSAIMLDIDHFKRLNDTFGHMAGDQVLTRVAECCRLELRGLDLAGRFGGDEFVILLPESGLAAAMKVAERLRGQITQKTFDIVNETTRVTVSLGVATIDWKKPTLQSLLDHADQALYAAKQNGRNQVYQDEG